MQWQFDLGDIAALLTVAAGLLYFWRQQRNRTASAECDEANAAESLASAAGKLLEPYQIEVGRLRADVAALRDALRLANDEIQRLQNGLGERDEEIARLRGELNTMHLALQAVTFERDALRDEVAALRDEVAALRSGQPVPAEVP